MNNFIGNILYLITTLFRLTYRYAFLEQDQLKKARELSPYNNYLYGIWHQNIIASLTAHTGKPHVTIVSTSKDGDLIDFTLKKMKYVTVRGSSTRRGAAAMKEMIREVKKGIPGAITMDGPKGPAKKVKRGIIELAKITGIPIVPLCAYPKKYWCFEKSWDQFVLPKPFSKIYLLPCDPIVISREEKDYEKIEKLIQDSLKNAEEKIKQNLL